MTVPVFNRLVHDVGFRPLDEPFPFGFKLTGGYTRSGQSYGSPTDFGGQADLLGNPTLSRWTQDDFLGGGYAYTWRDPAMFNNCENMMPSQFDRSLRTIPPIARWVNFSGNDGRVPIFMFGFGTHLWVVFSNGVARFDVTDGDTNLYGLDPDHIDPAIDDFGEFGEIIVAADFDRVNSDLFLAIDDSGSNHYLIRFRLPDYTFPSGEVEGFPVPNNGNRPITNFALHQSLIVAKCGQSLWTQPIKDDRTVANLATDWTNRGRLPAEWQASVSFNSQLYILCSTGTEGTTLVTYDPILGSILPVCDFPYNFHGESIYAHGGRLFVGGSGKDISGNDRHAELYEVSAASVRLVRTFSPEVDIDSASPPRSIYSFGSHEGQLFFGDTGKGLIAYDVTTDGLFGASRLEHPDTDSEIHALTSVRERLYMWVKDPTDSTKDGPHRVANATDAATGGVNDYWGVLDTSDFSPEIDRDKRWANFTVMTRYGNPALYYSQDGGETWVAVGGETTADGVIRLTRFDLSAAPTSARIRFRIALPRGKEVTTFTELVAFTCGFTFLDTGRWAWQITVDGTLYHEGHELAETEQDVLGIGELLRDWWMSGTKLVYRDLTGEDHNVTITRYSESQPVVGTPVTQGLDTTGREAFYNLTLLEA